jgi:deoxyribonucleoside regulator
MTDDRLLLRVAHLYYRSGLTQQEVAARLGLGRVKVSRLLTEAMQRGIVRIEIAHPLARLTELEYEVQRRYALDEVVVAAAPEIDDPALRVEAVAQAAADLLAGLAPPPRILGVSWGRTMYALAQHVRPGWASGVPVVQLNGSVSRSQRPTHAHRIAARLAETADAMAHLLAGPAIVERAAIREALESDRGIAATLEIARAADVAVFSLGAIAEDSVLVESGYLEPADVDRLRRAGAVGDLLSRFIAGDGRIVDPELDARTFGLPLSELPRKRRSIGVAAGREKTAIARAAVAGGYVNTLVIDELIAHDLLAAEPDSAEVAPSAL